MNLKLSFQLSALPFHCQSHGFALHADAGSLTLSVRYDYDPRPLTLSAPIKKGDLCEILLLDHRIALSVNGTLADEEWPAGRCLAEPQALSRCLHTEPYVAPATPPAVLGTFENAEGWRPEENVFVGDCMPYTRDGEYHVLYLKDRHHHHSKWGLGAHQWEHISTRDFKTWQIHPTAVPITDPNEGSICTGSWIREGEVEYLFYTVRRGTGIPAPIRRSVSRNGYHFEKDPAFGFCLSEKYRTASARDPKVFKGADGRFHMLLTTALNAIQKGCLAHLISKDLTHWEEADEPLLITADGGSPECPDYFFYNGYYYLVYSLEGKARYALSRHPFEGFSEPENPVIPCGWVPKAAPWRGQLIFTGFEQLENYAGTMTFTAATADEKGILRFHKLP